MGNIVNGKNSTVFYHEWLDLLDEDFTDEEAGQILKAVLRYDRDGTDTKFSDRGMKSLFKQMKLLTERNRERYDSACQKKAEYYKKKGKKNTAVDYSTLENTIEDYSVLDDNDNENVNVNVNVNDNVNVNVNVNENVNESGGGSGNDKTQPPQPPLSDNEISLIVEAWNLQSCTNSIKGIANGKRMANTLGCINGNFGAFLDTIRDLDNQKYFAGKKITFDWFAIPENYQKVAEGNYRDIFGAKTKGTSREEIMKLL